MNSKPNEKKVAFLSKAAIDLNSTVYANTQTVILIFIKIPINTYGDAGLNTKFELPPLFFELC